MRTTVKICAFLLSIAVVLTLIVGGVYATYYTPTNVNVSISATPATPSWTYVWDEYYLVGKIHGNEGMWSVSPDNQNVKLTKVSNQGNNVAIAYGVSLSAGDEIKVVWNYNGENGQSSQWYGAPGGSNVYISSTGTYNIYLYNDSGYFVSAAKQ